MTSKFLLVAFAATALVLGSGAAFAGIIMPGQPVFHAPPSEAVARGLIDPNYKPGGARSGIDPNFKPADVRGIVDPNYKPGATRGAIDPNERSRG